MSGREKAVLGGLVLATLVLTSVNFRSPFVHHNESCGTQVGKLTRNYFKFGYGKAGFGVLDVSGPSLEAYDDYRKYHYTTHPPMTYWLASLTMRIVDGEGGVRLVPILFAAGCVAMFYLLVRRKEGPVTAAIAAGLLAAFPMFAYNAVATVHLVVILFLILLALWTYLRWRETGKRSQFVLLAAIQVVACWTDWQGYYIAILIAAHLWWTDRSRWRHGLALLLLNGLAFAGYVAFVVSLDPVNRSGLALLFRAGGERAALRAADLPRFVFGEGREVLIYFTVAGVALAVWEAVKTRDRFLLCLLLLGLDELLFIPYALLHDYFTFCLAPFFAWGAARRVSALSRDSRPWARPLLAACGLAFVVQAAVILQNRWSRQGGYEFYYRMAEAINETTRPGEKLVLLTDDIRFYTPYYADRYMLWYNRAGNELVPENSAGRRKLDPGGLEEVLRKNREGLAYAVTATPEGIRRQVTFLANASDATLQSFGADDAYHDFLQKLCGPPVERRGFLFWKLPRF